MSLFFLSLSLYVYVLYFNKKIMVLLSLEMGFICLVCLYLSSSFSAINSSYFSGLIFLTFMVIDSVLGICILISSVRDSTLTSVDGSF